MKSFRRVFKYVWPQWQRILVIVVSGVVCSALLSLNFMTLLPLLKVITGEEDLHHWVHRKIVSHRYGMDIYLPEKSDFFKSDFAYYIQLINVRDGGLAQKSGLRADDQIIGAGESLVDEQHENVSAENLLAILAKAPSNEMLTIQVRRLNENGRAEVVTVPLKTGRKAFYVNYIERAVSFLLSGEGEGNKKRSLEIIILALVIVTIIRCLAKFCQTYTAQKVVQVAINRLRGVAYRRVMNVPMGYFASGKPSDTMSRIIGDTASMGTGIKILLGKALQEPLNAAFLIAWAMVINLKLSLIFLCGAPFVLWLIAVFGNKMKRATKRSLVATSQMMGKMQGTTQGLKVVKVYNQQENEHRAFDAINQKLLKQLLKISKVDAATSPLLEIFGMFAMSAALLAGAQWMQSGRMEGSEFIMLLGLLGSAAEAVRKTSDFWNKLQQANAAAERVYAIIDQPIEFEEAGAIELSPLKEKIAFRDVVFTYPGSDRAVLKGVNLTVRAGHNVAIVGPNGSGKTTLASLLPRFYDPDSGSILIDGQDIRRGTLRSLRNQIGLVTQDIVTFNDTIAANIAYAKPEATREEVIAAARRSFAHEFIEPLPNGYDTMIGEQGVGLSGGQLQRIVIARAILKNPPILIFDEATSQVDAESEAKIHKAIEEIMRNRTSFIIAHRFSTVVSADVIVVMDNGQILAQGQHSELIKDCRLYQNLYQTQLLTHE